MIERFIIQVLRANIEKYTSEPQRITRFFEQEMRLSSAEAAKVRETFLADPPTAIMQYPRQDSPFPLFSVVLADENETQLALDDYGGVFTEDDVGGDSLLLGAEELTSIYTHQFNIDIYTENPDVTVWYYQLVKAFMTHGKRYFKERGVLSTRFGGKDLAPSTAYAPEWLFIRRLTMSCQREQILVGDRAEGIVNEISGVHVDDGTVLTSVLPNVVPYIED